MRRCTLAAALITFCATLAAQAGGPPAPQPDKGDKLPPGLPTGKNAELGQQLIKALKEAPGCLGVETAFTVSGKAVIFSWFKDKKALQAWYYSPAHQKMMKENFPGQTTIKPLKNIPDDCGPILA